MSWLRRNREEVATEATVLRLLADSALAAAEAYAVAAERVEEGELTRLFEKLRRRHLEFAEDLRKRARKLGADVGAEASAAEGAGRLLARIHAAGSVRDLLIAMRTGEENGVAMCREALEESELSGRSASLIEAYLRAHIDHIRELSEQIALRGRYASTMAEFAGPQWLRYPQPGFWLFQGAVLLLGYLFGRRGKRDQSSTRESPRAQLGGEQATREYGQQIARELGR
ncbi:DUF2383 domain-containing protein [Kallotenue papyrolyticum]|uniref:DUF2383 domain-containing protein n=1 Tax=Kallotenue papyrolyticum TaxID=1325125 RepID=UPI0004786299|nr:DUF2383 domain-containing protein [Kallotenue papyrolyticum]